MSLAKEWQVVRPEHYELLWEELAPAFQDSLDVVHAVYTLDLIKELLYKPHSDLLYNSARKSGIIVQEDAEKGLNFVVSGFSKGIIQSNEFLSLVLDLKDDYSKIYFHGRRAWGRFFNKSNGFTVSRNEDKTYRYTYEEAICQQRFQH